MWKTSIRRQALNKHQSTNNCYSTRWGQRCENICTGRKMKCLGCLRLEYKVSAGAWSMGSAGNWTETNKIWLTFLGNKLLSLSLLLLRYSETSQPKTLWVVSFIKMTLLKSCNTGVFYESKSECNMKSNVLYKHNVRIGKSERMGNSSGDCYSTVSLYFVQLKSLLLALSAGLYKTETSRNTHFSTHYKGNYSISWFFSTHKLPSLLA